MEVTVRLLVIEDHTFRYGVWINKVFNKDLCIITKHGVDFFVFDVVSMKGYDGFHRCIYDIIDSYDSLEEAINSIKTLHYTPTKE